MRARGDAHARIITLRRRSFIRNIMNTRGTRGSANKYKIDPGCVLECVEGACIVIPIGCCL